MADLPSEASQLAARAAQECRALRVLINGNAVDLSDLDTTAKGSLVAAINELFATGGGGGITLTNYSQISALTGYPATFPPTIGSGTTDAMAGNQTAADLGAPAGHNSTHAAEGSDALTLTAAQISDLASATVANAMGAGEAGALIFGTDADRCEIAAAGITLGATFAASLRTAGNMAADYIAPTDTAGNVTIGLSHHRAALRMTAASGTSTITISVDGTTAYPAGFVVMVKRHGAGALAFSISGVTVNNNFLSAVAVGGWFALQKTSTASTWDMI